MEKSTESATKRNVIAATTGNILEWYDFAVYGYFAPILGKLFFPSDDPVASMLAAFGVFAIGYAARPIGGIILGHVGDRFGRKTSLIISVMAMGAATFAIGCLPTHAEIGTAAAFMLVLLRIIQGISVGGEYPGTIVFLAEHAADDNRGYLTSWPVFASILGFLMGSALGALLTSLLGENTMLDWGWRIPFLIGSLIAVCGTVFRRQMTEPAGLAEADESRELPIVTALRDYWREIATMVAVILVNSVGFYMLFVYAASYLTERMHVSTAKALDINTISLVAMILVTYVSARYCDRIGRKPLVVFVAIGTLILSWPLWWMMHHDQFWMILTGQLGFAVLFGIGYVATSPLMVELLPARVRFSGVAIGYNVCLGLFGGTAPLIATYLVQRTNDDFAPVWYLMAAALVSLLVIFRIPETAGEPLKNT